MTRYDHNNDRVQVSTRGEDAGEGKNGDDLQAWRNLMLMNVLLEHTHVCCVEKKDFQLHIACSLVLCSCALFSMTSSTHPHMKKMIFTKHFIPSYAFFTLSSCFLLFFFHKNSPIFRNHNCVIAALLGQRLLPGCQLLFLNYFVEIWSTFVLIKSLIDVSWDDHTSSICRGGILLGSSNSIVSNKTKLEHCVHFN